MPFDSLYLVLVLPALIFSMWAQHSITSNFKKFSKKRVAGGTTGAEAAEAVLKKAGIANVKIKHVPGNLTDHFDPRTNTIGLSDSVYNSDSIAAVGVAAHEAGHAIQYKNSYFPMQIRAFIIPVTNFGSKLAIPLVLLGLFLNMAGLIDLGIILFGTVVVFQVITLPVEYNASNRALAALSESKILTKSEMPGAKKVLSAAALTYVGALAVSLAQLISLIARRRN
ncbi:MAG: zinc metallopeptidase [Pseudomonadales bacterium]|jgi:Zn-dependent membrane protease YugP|nr:zinc metallopeptidase [Pseudomonadales bacterium]